MSDSAQALSVLSELKRKRVVIKYASELLLIRDLILTGNVTERHDELPDKSTLGRRHRDRIRLWRVLCSSEGRFHYAFIPGGDFPHQFSGHLWMRINQVCRFAGID